jgi:hypothetical protein
MLDCIIDIFERYQTFIAGVLGFTGVIITILMNAKFARDQHQKELQHETSTIRNALVTELTLLCDSYKLRIKQFNDTKGRAALINDYVANQVYLQLLPRIGLLTKTEIEKVMTAQQLNNELPFRLSLLTKDLNLPENKGYIKVTAEQAPVVSQLHESFLSLIDGALKELVKNQSSVKAL